MATITVMPPLFQIDSTAFRFLNAGIANPIFDGLFPFITEVKHWHLVYVALIGGLLWKGGTRGRWCAAALLVGVLLSDQFSSFVLKNWVSRVRPCASLDDVRLLVGCGAGKSFPSSHAVNNAMAATVLWMFYPRYRVLATSIAFLVSFSRVYVGVHYPADVIGGWIVGVAVGAGVAWCALRGEEAWKVRRQRHG